MFRFLLGALIGAAATASYIQRPLSRPTMRGMGRVDELSSADLNPIADPAVNAGDGTPGSDGTENRSSVVTR